MNNESCYLFYVLESSCSVDLCTLTKEVTHTLSLPLVGGAHESNGIIRFMLCVMGTGMQEETNRIVQTRRISYVCVCVHVEYNKYNPLMTLNPSLY